jgi:hypothetical protein
MNIDHASAIVAAVLYEGYILYPYRPSSVKNQQRWTFGGVFPEEYAAFGGGDPCTMQTQCLLRGAPQTAVELRVRFLHLVAREIGAVSEPLTDLPATGEPSFAPVASLEVEEKRFLAWEEAVERDIIAPLATIEQLLETVTVPFALPGSREFEAIRTAAGCIAGVVIRTTLGVEGRVVISAAPEAPGTYRLTVRIENVTPLSLPEIASRQLAQRRAFASTHTLLGVRDGSFVSMMDPPDDLREIAARCENQGTWPVLIGKPGAADTVLSSPIILYDYPEIAPESAGDLFDATEIDEILILRILTMTEDEKCDMAAVDPRARALLERTAGLSPAQLDRLHGTLRDPRSAFHSSPASGNGVVLKVGDRVRLRPKAGGDVFDIVLKDQVAIVESIERDFENRVHVAVTLLDDPGRDLGMQRMPGHRFFFAPSEVESLQSEPAQ